MSVMLVAATFWGVFFIMHPPVFMLVPTHPHPCMNLIQYLVADMHACMYIRSRSRQSSLIATCRAPPSERRH